MATYKSGNLVGTSMPGRKNILIALTLATLLGLAGCIGTTTDAAIPADTQSAGEVGDIHRVVFAEDEHVCYAYSWSEAGGIDCHARNASTDYYDRDADSDARVPSGTNSVDIGAGTITRIEYPQDKRVCYAYSWSEAGGIDCLPLSEEGAA